MRILLSTLNAKFIHSSLALAYLKEFCRDDAWDISIKEYTINEKTDYIMADIFLTRPDVLCFSCYIWNIKPILSICRNLKKIIPGIVIILGGPEVSYDARRILSKNKAIDYIIRGEGEHTLKELLQAIYYQTSQHEIKGLTYRSDDKIHENPERELITDLDIIPSPYKGNLSDFESRIIYYETSRGCPFSCSYCMSSIVKGVRFFSIERVKEDLSFLIEQRVIEVKFVDRTFNYNEKRAREIMKFIMEKKGQTKFHFEIRADLLSDEMISFIQDVPPGLFDFEIGVQSTCLKTLEAINRKYDWTRLSRNVKALRAGDNVHLHLDLIAGLPFEDYTKFSGSFNDVYSLSPDVIQLGFLKLLKGSSIRTKSEEYNYKFQEEPPYQVLENDFLKYGEIIRLAKIEDLLSRYYNSGDMPNTLSYIVENIFNGDAFKFYESFVSYWEEQGLFNRAHKKTAGYGFLKSYVDSFYSTHSLLVNDLLKYDYLVNNNSYNLPPGIESYNPDKTSELLYSLLKEKNFLEKHLPHMCSKTVREIRRQVHMEYFRYDPLSLTELEGLSPFIFVYDPVQKKAYKIIPLEGDCLFA